MLTLIRISESLPTKYVVVLLTVPALLLLHPSRSEGLLWHVMLTPIKISTSLLTKYLEAVGDLMCGPSAEFVEELAKAEKYFRAPAANKGEGNRLSVSAADRWVCACSELQAILQETDVLAHSNHDGCGSTA
jgi:hypothetical protein